MGKGGRIACILTPMLLTIASLVTQAFIEAGGWSKSSDTFDSLYFMRANFSAMDLTDASTLSNSTQLTAALAIAQAEGKLADIYQIYLWNYCSANKSTTHMDQCSKRQSYFWFNPVEVWGLNTTNISAANTTISSGNDPVSSAVNNAANDITNSTSQLEENVLGKTGKEALDAYEHVAKWMFIAFAVSFWLALATIVVGIFAVFSRIGSFFTWLLSIASSFFSFAASLTATILFAALSGSLETILHPYKIKVDVGTHALAITWLATLFSMAATLFWLFSVCCCSGRSNPHHRSNKGGLWAAEPKGQGYGDYGHGPAAGGRGRGLRVEKTGGGYERVASPFLGGEHGDRVPLHDYPQQQTGFASAQPKGSAYEPFRQY